MDYQEFCNDIYKTLDIVNSENSLSNFKMREAQITCARVKKNCKEIKEEVRKILWAIRLL